MKVKQKQFYTEYFSLPMLLGIIGALVGTLLGQTATGTSPAWQLGIAVATAIAGIGIGIQGTLLFQINQSKKQIIRLVKKIAMSHKQLDEMLAASNVKDSYNVYIYKLLNENLPIFLYLIQESFEQFNVWHVGMGKVHEHCFKIAKIAKSSIICVHDKEINELTFGNDQRTRWSSRYHGELRSASEMRSVDVKRIIILRESSGDLTDQSLVNAYWKYNESVETFYIAEQDFLAELKGEFQDIVRAPSFHDGMRVDNSLIWHYDRDIKKLSFLVTFKNNHDLPEQWTTPHDDHMTSLVRLFEGFDTWLELNCQTTSREKNRHGNRKGDLPLRRSNPCWPFKRFPPPTMTEAGDYVI